MRITATLVCAILTGITCLIGYALSIYCIVMMDDPGAASISMHIGIYLFILVNAIVFNIVGLTLSPILLSIIMCFTNFQYHGESDESATFSKVFLVVDIILLWFVLIHLVLMLNLLGESGESDTGEGLWSRNWQVGDESRAITPEYSPPSYRNQSASTSRAS